MNLLSNPVSTHHPKKSSVRPLSMCCWLPMRREERSSYVTKWLASKSMRLTRLSTYLLTRIRHSWSSKDSREICHKFIVITSSLTNLWSRRTKHLKLWCRWVSRLKVTKATKIYGKLFGVTNLQSQVTKSWFWVWRLWCAQFKTCRWIGCTSLKLRGSLSSLKRSKQLSSLRIWDWHRTGRTSWWRQKLNTTPRWMKWRN